MLAGVLARCGITAQGRRRCSVTILRRAEGDGGFLVADSVWKRVSWLTKPTELRIPARSQRPLMNAVDDTKFPASQEAPTDIIFTANSPLEWLELSACDPVWRLSLRASMEHSLLVAKHQVLWPIMEYIRATEFHFRPNRHRLSL
jgi:hypothetical protein